MNELILEIRETLQAVQMACMVFVFYQFANLTLRCIQCLQSRHISRVEPTDSISSQWRSP